MRISDWSSDVCSSDLGVGVVPIGLRAGVKAALRCVRSVAVMSVTVQEGHTSSREAELRSELDEALSRRFLPRRLLRASLGAVARSRRAVRAHRVGCRGQGYEVGRATVREKWCQYGVVTGGGGYVNKK